MRALRDCKQRSLTVSKKAPTVSRKSSPVNFRGGGVPKVAVIFKFGEAFYVLLSFSRDCNIVVLLRTSRLARKHCHCMGNKQNIKKSTESSRE